MCLDSITTIKNKIIKYESNLSQTFWLASEFSNFSIVLKRIRII